MPDLDFYRFSSNNRKNPSLKCYLEKSLNGEFIAITICNSYKWKEQKARSHSWNVTENTLKYSKLLIVTMVNRDVFSVEKCVRSTVKNRLKCNLVVRERGKDHVVHFTHVFRPIYYFNRLCGHMPFSIVQSLNDKFHHQSRVSVFDVLWFIISICIYTGLASCICWYLNRALSLYAVKPILYFLASTINGLRLINFLCGILMLSMDMCSRQRHVYIFNKFTAFDRKVSVRHRILGKVNSDK